MSMSVVRVGPFEELSKMRREVNRLFDDIFPLRPIRELELLELAWTPSLEMYETDSEVVVRAALPNIDPKMVDITVTNSTLVLKGETKHEEERKGRNYYRRELQAGAFLRSVPLLHEVKGAEARATYKDGILEVKLPKTERAKASLIKVKVE
jgi:HSP20 family protein